MASRLLIVPFLLFVQGVATGQETVMPLDFIEVGKDHKGFVLERSGRRFVPWGFNYDHDAAGRLIEDYWDDAVAKVEQDFGEMKALGATVVRIHLQFGKFMDAPDKPNEHSLKQLARLVRSGRERSGSIST